jgi:phosphatidylserine/phosphatidylglycerophosphate/cardiolipin synthase-like enzyme
MKIIAVLLALATQASAGEVWFAPQDNCTAVIVRELDKATKSINVQAYNFTSEPIGDALMRAEQRGVVVRVLLDRRAPFQGNSQAQRLKASGAEVMLDARHPIAHVKYSGIDGERFLGGSFNYSKQANRNSEDLTLEDDPKLVKEFAGNFERHWAHGKPFVAQTTKTRRRLR